MFSSDQPKIDTVDVKEFQLPGLTDESQAPPPLVCEFKPWDYDNPGGGSLAGEEPEPQAEDILAAAREKAEEIERQAYEDGFEQGQKDGRELGRRSLEEVVHRFSNLASDLEREREGLFHYREGLLLDLVLLVSSKLVARELSLHPEAVRQIIEEGFRQVASLEGLKLCVSPPDYEILRQENLESWPPGVELAIDGTLTPGGFRLETALGEVDGTRETRWALVEQTIQEALESMDAPPGNP